MRPLDERLLAIYEMTGECETFADIGCDHGRLGAWLLLNDKVRFAQFIDISPVSVEKARRLVTRLGLAERAAFLAGDGADALLGECDAAVISGMGAGAIRGILERGRDKLRRARVIAQPNLDEFELRAYLAESGYKITDERVARAAGRWYVIMAFEAGSMSLTPREIITGTDYMRADREAYRGYVQFRVRVLSRALGGAEKSPDARDAEDIARKLALWRAEA